MAPLQSITSLKSCAENNEDREGLKGHRERICTSTKMKHMGRSRCRHRWFLLLYYSLEVKDLTNNKGIQVPHDTGAHYTFFTLQNTVDLVSCSSLLLQSTR